MAVMQRQSTAFAPAPPPRPPEAQGASSLSSLTGIVQRQGKFLYALTVWLQQQMAAIRTAMVGYSSVRTYSNLTGTKDGANQTFTSPFVIARASDGTPLGMLNWKGTLPQYTTSAAPGSGYFTVVSVSTSPATTTILMGDAPAAPDVLQWAFAVGVP